METVRVRHRKWPERPHWESDGLLLGADEHGRWLGYPPGSLMSRPGSQFRTTWTQVTLVPEGQPFMASFYGGPEPPCQVYVDITTHPVWEGSTVTAVDLDLDVVRGRTGRVWVDDEDEFADHRVRFGYPDEVVRLATASCDAVLSAVGSARPPYDGTVGARWLERLDVLMMGR